MVIFREGEREFKLVARFVTDNAFFKAGNKAFRAEFKMVIFGGATLEGFAVFFADKVDDDFIAERGGFLFGLLFGLGLADVFDDFVDVFFFNF